MLSRGYSLIFFFTFALMKFTANQISDVLNGEVVGDPTTEVHTLSKIEEGSLGALTFLANPKYTSHIYTTKASVVIVNNDFVPKKKLDLTLVKVENAYSAFSTLLEYYNLSKNNKVGIESPLFISDSASYGKDVYIGAFSHIGDHVVIGDNVKIYPNTFIGDNVTIGSNTTLFSGVKIYFDCIIGANCYVNSGAVIGADGFGFSPDENGVYKKIPQIGNVLLEEISMFFFKLTEIYQFIGMIKGFNENFEDYSWNDSNRARQLVNNGIRNISENPDKEELRQILISLYDMIPDTERPSDDGGLVTG